MLSMLAPKSMLEEGRERGWTTGVRDTVIVDRDEGRVHEGEANVDWTAK